MPSAPATSHKGGVELGKERGPVVKFPVLKLFGPVWGGDLGRLGKSLGTLRVEGGAEVSELISGTGWGGGWQLGWPGEGGREEGT